MFVVDSISQHSYSHKSLMELFSGDFLPLVFSPKKNLIIVTSYWICRILHVNPQYVIFFNQFGVIGKNPSWNQSLCLHDIWTNQTIVLVQLKLPM